MSNKTNTELKQTFQTGDVPTEAQFGDLIDSSRNMYLDKSVIADLATFNEGGCTFEGSSGGFCYISQSSPPAFLDIPWKPYDCRIPTSAFSSIVITALNIPPNITEIGSRAFNYCSNIAGAVKVPDSVTSVGSYAFTYCSNIDTVVLPSLTSLGSNAFYSCAALDTLYTTANKSVIDGDSSTFSSSILATVYVNTTIATGWTIAGSQTVGGKAGVNVVEWTSYPDPM